MKKYRLTIKDLGTKEVLNTMEVDELEVLRSYYAATRRSQVKSRVYTQPYSLDSAHDYITTLIQKHYPTGLSPVEYRYDELYDGDEG